MRWVEDDFQNDGWTVWVVNDAFQIIQHTKYNDVSN